MPRSKTPAVQVYDGFILEVMRKWCWLRLRDVTRGDKYADVQAKVRIDSFPARQRRYVQEGMPIRWTFRPPRQWLNVIVRRWTPAQLRGAKKRAKRMARVFSRVCQPSQ